MSLDVYLKTKEHVTVKGSSGIFVRENGQTKEISVEEWNSRYPGREPVKLDQEPYETDIVFDGNITHNLNTMASKAGIYEALWRPHRLKQEYNISEDDYKAEYEFENNQTTLAKELIEPLRQGLHNLKSDPERYKKFNPENGWGNYDGLVRFVENYLNACYEFQDAEVTVSR